MSIEKPLDIKGCLTPADKLCGFAEDHKNGTVECKIARIKKISNEVKRRKRDYAGMGLGLTIVRSVEAFRTNGVQPETTVNCTQGFSGSNLENDWHVAVSRAIIQAAEVKLGTRGKKKKS